MKWERTLVSGVKLSNARLDDDEFKAMRNEVLSMWSTGEEARDLTTNAAYLKSLPAHKVFPLALAKAKKEGKIMVLPQVGQGTPEEMVGTLQFIEAAGADSFFVQCDAYTRKLRLREAEEAIKKSYTAGKSQLNGYPFINHGIARSRALIEGVNLPLFANANNDEDPRLLAEVAFASGFTNTLVFDLRDSLTHEKDYPLDQRIRNNQYVCRLLAYYSEQGIPIEASEGGTDIGCIGGTPGMGIAISVLGALTAVAQGVKYMSLVYDAQGNLLQDVAAMQVHRELTERYLRRFGYKDVILSSALYPWTGAWPRNEWAAAVLMAWFATIAALGKANWIFTKTPREAFDIPSRDINAASVMITKYAFNLVDKQVFTFGTDYEEERAMLEREAVAIIEAVLELGQGDAAVGRLRSLEAGVIDVPYPSYEWTRRAVLTARDANNAVRWLEVGNVPLPREVVAYHSAKLSERRAKENISDDLEMMIDDMMALARLPIRPG